MTVWRAAATDPDLGAVVFWASSWIKARDRANAFCVEANLRRDPKNPHIPAARLGKPTKFTLNPTRDGIIEFLNTHCDLGKA